MTLVLIWLGVALAVWLVIEVAVAAFAPASWFDFSGEAESVDEGP